MFGPSAFTVRKEVSTFDKLRGKRETISVQVDAVARLRVNDADCKENCDYSQAQTLTSSNWFHWGGLW